MEGVLGGDEALEGGRSGRGLKVLGLVVVLDDDRDAVERAELFCSPIFSVESLGCVPGIRIDDDEGVEPRGVVILFDPGEVGSSASRPGRQHGFWRSSSRQRRTIRRAAPEARPSARARATSRRPPQRASITGRPLVSSPTPFPWNISAGCVDVKSGRTNRDTVFIFGHKSYKGSLRAATDGRNVMRVCRPAGHSWRSNPLNGFPSNARFAHCLPSAEHLAMTSARSVDHGVREGNAKCSYDGNAPQTLALLIFTPPSSPRKRGGPEIRQRFREPQGDRVFPVPVGEETT